MFAVHVLWNYFPITDMLVHNNTIFTVKYQRHSHDLWRWGLTFAVFIYLPSGETCGCSFLISLCVCSVFSAEARCRCSGLFHGNRCELNNNPCVSNPCKDGTVCVPKSDGYMCNCSLDNPEARWTQILFIYFKHILNLLSPRDPGVTLYFDSP